MAAAEPKPSLVERLFADHRGALQTFFLRRIRAKADAADLAQEVYVRMLRMRDQQAIRKPVHYLYTVANNLVKEHAVLDRPLVAIDMRLPDRLVFRPKAEGKDGTSVPPGSNPPTVPVVAKKPT